MYNEIKTPHDVAAFFFYLIFEKRVNLHPDDSFHDYVDVDGNPSFTDKQADQYDEDMNKAFDVCEENGVDIYDINIAILELFFMCNPKK